MMRLTNSIVKNASNAVLVNCLALESVSDSDCTNTASTTFINCTGDYCISSDGSADFGINSLLNQNISSWLDSEGLINEVGQSVLIGSGSSSSDIIDWNYAQLSIITSTLSGTITNTIDGQYMCTFYNEDTNTHIETKAVTFTKESFSEVFEIPVGTNVLFASPRIDGDDQTGFADYGVTV